MGAIAWGHDLHKVLWVEGLDETVSQQDQARPRTGPPTGLSTAVEREPDPPTRDLLQDGR